MTQECDSMGVVVIGRNEGERLRRCLSALVGKVAAVIYVDSGSTDESVSMARAMGAEVVELDLTTPFTAARARNAGFRRLRQSNPASRFVAFFDGDCAVAEGWLAAGRRVLLSRTDVAVVCGRLREAAPQASIYNRLCDMEWDGAVGEIAACGGNAMVQAQAFEQVGGFNESLIAGEEPELCARLRAAGWRILRIEAPMAEHDAAMQRLSQWWRRAVRGGHALAETAWLHRDRLQLMMPVRRLVSIALWAGLCPAVALALAWPTGGISLVVLLVAYTALWLRIAARQVLGGRQFRHAALYAAFILLGKFAELTGIVRFAVGRLLRRRPRIIEYKHAAPAASVVSDAR